MQYKTTIAIVFLCFTLLAGCGAGSSGDDKNESDVESNAIVSLKIRPGNVTINSGITKSLSFQAYSIDGPVDSAPTWVSSNSDIVSIEPNGTLTAHTLGSATITAKVGEIEDQSVITVVKTTAETVIIDDESFLSEPVLVNEDEPFGLGSQYTVRLNNIDKPSVGEILMSDGDTPVGGRVVSVEEINGEQLVTLEMVAIDEIFEELKIDQEYDMANADYSLDPSVAALYDVSRDADGQMIFTLKQPLQKPGSLGARNLSARNLLDDLFKCDLQDGKPGEKILPPFKIELLPAQFALNVDLDFILKYDSEQDGLQQLKLKGKIDLGTELKLAMLAELAAQFECKWEMYTYTIPVGGPLALFFGGQVPTGLGMLVGGKITLAELGVKLTPKLKTNFELGVDCLSGECNGVADANADVDPNYFGLLYPEGANLDKQFRLKPEVGAFVFIDFKLGSKFTNKLDIKLLKSKFGVTMKGDFATVDAQLLDKTYRSKYDLLLEFVGGLGSDVDAFLKLVRIGTIKVEVKESIVLATSPTVEKIAALPYESTGTDLLRCSILLESANLDFLFMYNIDEVFIYREYLNEDGGTDSEEVAVLTAQDKQSLFQPDWLIPEDDIETVAYHAFVSTPIPTGFPLELGKCKPTPVVVEYVIEDDPILPDGWQTMKTSTFYQLSNENLIPAEKVYIEFDYDLSTIVEHPEGETDEQGIYDTDFKKGNASQPHMTVIAYDPYGGSGEVVVEFAETEEEEEERNNNAGDSPVCLGQFGDPNDPNCAL